MRKGRGRTAEEGVERLRAAGAGRGDGGWKHAACGPNDDTDWAREIDAGDVQACGGLLPKRVVREGGGGSADDEASEEAGGTREDGRRDKYESSVTSEAKIDEFDSRTQDELYQEIMAESGTASGLDNESELTNEPRSEECLAEVQKALGQEVMADTESAGGLDNDETAVTNEPNFDENAVGVQVVI